MINRAKFFASVRAYLFDGAMVQAQVDSINAILDEWERRKLKDLRWLAYMLGTVRRECGPMMCPVREGFKKTDAEARAFVRRQGYAYSVVVNGHVYYGRGLVQLTWFDNYRKMSDLLEIDLLNNPDLALDPKVAAKIMFEGMIRGTFTGKSLALYFNDYGTDWRNARRIVNGMDHADEVATFARLFHTALKGAQGVTGAAPPPPDIHPPIKTTKPTGFWAALTGLFKRKT